MYVVKIKRSPFFHFLFSAYSLSSITFYFIFGWISVEYPFEIPTKPMYFIYFSFCFISLFVWLFFAMRFNMLLLGNASIAYRIIDQNGMGNTIEIRDEWIERTLFPMKFSPPFLNSYLWYLSQLCYIQKPNRVIHWLSED